jgi:cation diffusion facilitator family transporter
VNSAQENAYKLRVLKWSTFTIVTVVFVEVSLGLFVNSLAILSDGLHALLDAMTGVLLFYATKAALKPPDEDHPYGHEKYETIGGLVGGMILIGIALLVIYEAAVRLYQGTSVNVGLEAAGFFAVGFTFCMDFVRIVIFRKAGSIESATIKVGFYHALADLSSTLIAFAGFALASLARVFWGDALASIMLGILLSYLSINLVKSSVLELSDAASKDITQKVSREIQSQPGVVKTLQLRTRKAGSKVFVETTVQVSNFMSLEEAHALASKLEERLKEAVGNVDATIHIEPSERDRGLEALVEQLAKVEGVCSADNISTAYAGGKLYITLHASVDPAMSVKQAHDIAEQVEKKMHQNIRQLEHVTVHVEPYKESASSLPSASLCEDDIRKIVDSVAKGIALNLHIKHIVTYEADGRSYINIDCGFTEHVSIAEAHDIASQLEKETRVKCHNAVVTVHLEPDSI